MILARTVEKVDALRRAYCLNDGGGFHAQGAGQGRGRIESGAVWLI